MNIWLLNPFVFELFLKSLPHKKYVYLYFLVSVRAGVFDMQKAINYSEVFSKKIWMSYLGLYIIKLKTHGLTYLYNAMIFYRKIHKHTKHNWHTRFHCLSVWTIYTKPIVMVYVGTIAHKIYALSSHSASISVSSKLLTASIKNSGSVLVMTNN